MRSGGLRIEVGDRFARVSTPHHVYVVTALVDKPGQPPHVRLQDESRPQDEVLVGVYALLNRDMWRHIG